MLTPTGKNSHSSNKNSSLYVHCCTDMSVGRQLPPVQQFSSHIQGCSTYFQIPPRPLDCFLFSVGKLYRNIFLVLPKSSATSQFDKINHTVQFASEVQSAAQKHNSQFVAKPKNPSLICKMSKLNLQSAVKPENPQL